MPRNTKKQRVQEYTSTRGWLSIGQAEWVDLRAAFPDVSEATIRAAVQAMGVTLALPWAGVEQHSLDDLAQSLTRMSEVYVRDPALRIFCRQQVIAAKTRARFLSRNPRVDEAKRALKAEMVEWLLIWLSDPALFPAWVALRRSALQQSAGDAAIL